MRKFEVARWVSFEVVSSVGIGSEQISTYMSCSKRLKGRDKESRAAHPYDATSVQPVKMAEDPENERSGSFDEHLSVPCHMSGITSYGWEAPIAGRPLGAMSLALGTVRH